MCVNKKIASNANNSVQKECSTRLMRSAIIKKASRDEQQNQTTITTKINFLQNFMSIFLIKKLGQNSVS